jgi:broad specificity phosphatase PhoE
MKLVLLRHAQTEWNLQNRYNSVTDLEICEPYGALNATIPFLKRIRPAVVLSSPLRRCLMTAEIVRAQLAPDAPDLEVDSELREIDFGVFEGERADEILRGSYAAEFVEWTNPKSNSIGAPEGETWEAVGERVSRIVSRLESIGSDVLVVTHGYLLRAILVRCLLGLGSQNLRRFSVDNSKLAYLTNDEGYWRLHLLNSSGGDEP